MILKSLINDENKRYFIFDTGVTRDDIDFIQYSWERTRFDKVRVGDYFIYRRPQTVSENRKFYFFGIGEIGSIDGGWNEVTGKVINPVRFTHFVYQDDPLFNNYEWKWKPRPRNDFQRFFNNYGMNQIPFEDFNYFCQLGIGEKLNEDFEKDNKELVESHISLLNVRQDTEDRWTLQKTRGYQQKVFSDNLRTVYSNKCCITDINTRNMIHGSHISPWRSDRGNRTNIKNGLLLSLIVHKCFDEGLISINNDYRVLVSSSISDKGLSEYLQKYENKKINLPVRKEYHPDKELLKKHRVKFNFE